jgi:hypothetical protein
MPPRRRASKDTPAKLAARMRSWRVSLLRGRAQYLGNVDAPHERAAEAAAAVQFGLDEEQRKRLAVEGGVRSPGGRRFSGVASWLRLTCVNGSASFCAGWRTWSGCSHVNRDAAFKAWGDGYSVREYAGEMAAPPLAPR